MKTDKQKPFMLRVTYVSLTGNLTKHMKSKAHMKKCLELGVSVTMDETEIQEHGKKLAFLLIFNTCKSKVTPKKDRGTMGHFFRDFQFMLSLCA